MTTQPHLVLKSQKNEIFQAIQKIGLQPSQFEWGEVPSIRLPLMTVSVLVHTPTNYYFRFDFQEGRHWCEYSPGTSQPVFATYPGSWSVVTPHVDSWLTNLKREVESPDLWKAVAQERALTTAAAKEGESNAPFTTDERRLVSVGLLEIKQYLLVVYPSSQQERAAIETRLAYLEQASERLGKKDWLNLAVGVLANIVVTLAMDADKARELFRLAGQALDWLLGAGQNLLP